MSSTPPSTRTSWTGLHDNSVTAPTSTIMLERKRAYSQAFQPVSGNIGFPRPVQAARYMGPSSVSASSIFYNPNEENEFWFAQDGGKISSIPNTAYEIPLFQQAFDPLANSAPIDFTAYTTALQPLPKQLFAGQNTSYHMMPVSSIEFFPEFPDISQCMGPTPSTVQKHSFSDLFQSRSSSSSVYSTDQASDIYWNLESSPVVYVNLDTQMSGSLIPTDPLTPSALGFNTLSLLDILKAPRQESLPRGLLRKDRTRAQLVPSSMFHGVFPSPIHPNKVVVIFDKGKKFEKVDKYPLCNASRIFAKLLDGPFLGSQVRTLRLRDDFPYAIHAMLTFIDKGFYTFHPETRLRFPHFSKLDYHVHAYLTGTKYAVTALCCHALSMYSMHTKVTLTAAFSTTSPLLSSLPMQTSAPHHSHDSSPVAELDRFLDSLVLVWRNTPDRSDALRYAALRLVQYFLNRLVRVKFFVTLMVELEGFGRDVVEMMGENGVQVRALTGGRGGVRFGEGW